jgi:hypothetical protein
MAFPAKVANAEDIAFALGLLLHDAIDTAQGGTLYAVDAQS